jgi:hypothetical protein
MKFKALMPLLFSSVAFAGGTGGGSTPPAMEDSALMNVDMTAISGDDGLSFDSKKPLRDTIIVSQDNAFEDTFKISPKDALLLGSIKSLNPTADAIDQSGLKKSYLIEDGDTLGSYKFTDRRSLIRNDVLSNK